MIPPVYRRGARVLLAVLPFALAALVLWHAAPSMVADRIRGLAADRGLRASWRSLRLGLPFDIAVRGLVLSDAAGDATTRIESLDVAIDPWSVVTLSPRPSRVVLAGARLTSAGRPEPDDVTTTAPRRRGPLVPDRLPRIRAAARRAARLLLIDPPSLRVSIRDVTVVSLEPDEAPRTTLRIDALELSPRDGAVWLTARGIARLEDPTPFSAQLSYERDGRLRGGVDFELLQGERREHLPMGFDAHLVRGGVPRALRLADGSRVVIGPVSIGVSGFIEPDVPRFRFSLAATGVRPDQIVRRVPASLLGPLADLRITGSFDYALVFDLDLDRPDSVSFDADVRPHGLALDPRGETQVALAAPFTAHIHLPHGRIVDREMSGANPHFRPLETIDSTLVHAVVANEDGGFFRHRGFNVEALRQAIVENLHAGAYRRGAGTITMQLARNLYLGHERTLARKGQEVVMAWVLEHLTGVSKQRLLEIYLNIIEWGPGVHGADEACQYYFGHDAGRVTVDEALFLATVVPAPSKWRYRFDRDGALRASERAQMHFIGRAMVAKGWLDAASLPPAESLAVDLAGPAREVLFPPAPNDPNAQPTGATSHDVETAPH